MSKTKEHFRANDYRIPPAFPAPASGRRLGLIDYELRQAVRDALPHYSYAEIMAIVHEEMDQ